ncbi:MAG: hypothetical protein J3K34DRAFT_398933 [Monoraphidium minutum]|nr:MAG: hypothetical protein J3K34DRAFT_398933 [Monoraphidium minutum]
MMINSRTHPLATRTHTRTARRAALSGRAAGAPPLGRDPGRWRAAAPISFPPALGSPYPCPRDTAFRLAARAHLVFTNAAAATLSAAGARRLRCGRGAGVRGVAPCAHPACCPPPHFDLAAVGGPVSRPAAGGALASIGPRTRRHGRFMRQRPMRRCLCHRGRHCSGTGAGRPPRGAQTPPAAPRRTRLCPISHWCNVRS